MAVPAVKDGGAASRDMNELLQQLTVAENAKFLAEQDAAKRMRLAEAQVVDATEVLADCRRQHQQQIARLNAKFDKRLRDAAYNARKEVREAEEAAVTSEANAMMKEEEEHRAEIKVRVLEKKVAELQVQLGIRIEESERRCVMAEWENEERVRRIVTQCSHRIETMTEHCGEVEEAANTAMEQVQSEHDYQLNLAHMRAEGRARFKELCDLSGKRGRKEVTKEVFDQAKDDILSVWRRQSVSPALQASPSMLENFTDVDLPPMPSPSGAGPRSGRFNTQRPRSQGAW